jgi:hypothetical protein
MRNKFGIEQDDPAVQRQLEKVNQIELAIDLFKQCEKIPPDERQNMLKDQRKALILEKEMMREMASVMKYRQVQNNLYNRLMPTPLNRESWEAMNQEQREHYHKIIKKAYDDTKKHKW